MRLGLRTHYEKQDAYGGDLFKWVFDEVGFSESLTVLVINHDVQLHGGLCRLYMVMMCEQIFNKRPNRQQYFLANL